MTATLTLEEIVTAAGGIPGWMTPDELRWLAEQAQRRSLIVEIGSWQGRSTKALALASPGIVYAVDDWRGEQDVPLTPYELQQAFLGNLLPELTSGKVICLNKPSSSAAQVFAARGWRPDLVFIDGDHSYAAVCQDVTLWLPLLAQGGLLAGHDYHQVGVRDALRDVLPNAVHLEGVGSIWMWEAPR